MSASERNVEAILDDLYASEINASISWTWDGGFYVTIGAKTRRGMGAPKHR